MGIIFKCILNYKRNTEGVRTMRMHYKAQSYIEYILLGIVGIAIITLILAPLIHDTSDYISNHAPTSNRAAILPRVDGLGVDANAFIDNFTELKNDPTAVDCVAEIVSTIDILNDVKSGNASSISDQDLKDLLNKVTVLGYNAVHSDDLIDASLCSSYNAANEIMDDLYDNLIKMEPNTQICIEGCTIATGSNTIMRHIENLLASGTIPSSVFSSCPPKTGTGTTIVSSATIASQSTTDILYNYYYIYSDYSRDVKIMNISNTINLMECVISTPGLPQSMMDMYATLLAETKLGLSLVISGSSGSSSGSSSTTTTAPSGTIEFCN
jgi:hypothetical protein